MLKQIYEQLNKGVLLKNWKELSALNLKSRVPKYRVQDFYEKTNVNFLVAQSKFKNRNTNN